MYVALALYMAYNTYIAEEVTMESATELRTPLEWQAQEWCTRVVLEPFGWTKGADGLPPVSWETPITRKEYLLRSMRSTLTFRPYGYSALVAQ
jgi:hypothetical protein